MTETNDLVLPISVWVDMVWELESVEMINPPKININKRRKLFAAVEHYYKVDRTFINDIINNGDSRRIKYLERSRIKWLGR